VTINATFVGDLLSCSWSQGVVPLQRLEAAIAVQLVNQFGQMLEGCTPSLMARRSAE
jgi:hypothetical protein